jgi:hypothetical protein
MQWIRVRFACATLSLVALFVTLPASAAAQSIGGRVGVSADPDQFYFGVHYETKPLVDRLTFRPNIEIGIGDDTTLAALNFEFAYKFAEPKGAWKLYAGGGPALNIYSGDRGAEGGFNILLGIAHKDGLFFEVKVGAIDSPSFKFGVGYVFK